MILSPSQLEALTDGHARDRAHPIPFSDLMGGYSAEFFPPADVPDSAYVPTPIRDVTTETATDTHLSV